MSAAVVVITPSELTALVHEAVRSALADHDRGRLDEARPLSAREVAKLARKGRVVVAAAITAGVLPAERSGDSFRIATSAARAWIAAGCPVEQGRP